MAASYRRKQGASLWVDIDCPDVALIDPLPDAWLDINRWKGFFNIIDSAGAIVLSGNLAKSAIVGKFLLRIGRAGYGEWATLPVSKYTLTYQITNASVDYDDEDSDKLEIVKQNYVVMP